MKQLKNIFNSTLHFFFFFCILFIPFPYRILSWQKNISQFIFEDITSGILKGVFNFYLINEEISSDSASMYVLLFFLLFIGLLAGLFFNFIQKLKDKKVVFFKWINIMSIYYLSLQLLKYGFHKIFKGQFYLPEPNILFTPFGQLDKDILFWSTMGTSYEYNLFMGMLELIPGILLLFRKTRVLGLIISFPVLLNIVAINFSYDISVKIFSTFLLFLSLFLLFPYLKSVFSFFFRKEIVVLHQPAIVAFKTPLLKSILKCIVILFIFSESLYPYISTWNFNDDTLQRPYLHGAYEVEKVQGADGIINIDSLGIKRIFIHRRGYIIFQDDNDNMQDFNLKIDRIKNTFTLTDYQLNSREINYSYQEKDSTLQIQFFQKGNEFLLETKALDWQSLPALQRQFHWTIEGVE